MDDDKLIEKLEEGVREAEELLQRRKQALKALKGQSASGKKVGRARGLRTGSIPALAVAILKAHKQPMSLDDLTTQLKKHKASLEPRMLSIALSKYVREGQYFSVGDDGKYSAK